jgi:hypothetical protein
MKDKSSTSQESPNKVFVYYRDGMAISRSLRDTVERCRRALNRICKTGRDLYVYTNYAEGDCADGGKGSPMVKMSGIGDKPIALITRNGTKTITGISPKTLLAALEAGQCPEPES